jgi:tRNA(fMet)-specific endonuclease VapC
MILALDANIISYILKEDDDVVSRYRKEIMQGNTFIMPPVAFYEVQRGLLARRLLKKMKIFEDFCKDVDVGVFDTQMWLKSAQIYAALNQKGKPVGGDGDIQIAAFCLVNDYTLVTNNTKHFEHIDGLKLVNWKQ